MSKAPNMTAPAWWPDEGTTELANLTQAVAERGFSTYDEFYRWSITEADEFWHFVIDQIGIEFDQAPAAIRASTDVTDPQWLPGAMYNIVTSCLDHDPASTAITYGGSSNLETVTVAELRSMTAAFAAGFVDAGFSVGDAIAIVMPMNIEAVVAYLGTIAAGGMVVSIADSFAPDEIRTRLEIAEPVAVVTQTRTIRAGKTLPMYQKCIDAGSTPCIVVDGGGRFALRDRDITWDKFIDEGALFDPVPMPASAHTNVLFSSGTTGEPKAIPWTQTTPIKAGMDGRFHHDIHLGDVVAWPTNLGWMMGPWLIFASLLNGAAMALYDDAPTTRAFVEFVDNAGVTMLGVVPSMVASWRGSGVLTRGDWPTVRVLSSTGEASNAEDATWLMSAAGDVPMVEYCGGTEIGGGYVTSTVLQPSVPARFSTPALGLDLVLIGADGRESDEGEVFLVPPSIGLSDELLNGDHRDVYYAGVPDIGKPLRRHGDEMQRDASGYLRALGRVDDTMNLGGIKVSSAELESAISGTRGVIEAAAVAVTPPDGGPGSLVVFVVKTDSETVDPHVVRAEMQAGISRHLNPLFKIHDVVVVDALPRTASNKVMRRALRAEYSSRMAGD